MNINCQFSGRKLSLPSLQVEMSLHSDTLSWFQANQSLLLLLNVACLAEKQQIAISWSLNWPKLGLNLKIYHTQGEHTNDYTTDTVLNAEIEPHSWQDVLDTTLCDKVCQWQVSSFLQVLWFPPPIKLTPQNNWNIVESGVKHYNP